MNNVSKVSYQLCCLLRWVGRRFVDRFRRVDAPVHIFFCSTDHFEPGSGGVPPSEEAARMHALLSDYPGMADHHRDHDGRLPRRTWFFPPHYHRNGNLKALVGLCARGYGEIELHLHHGKTAPDTEENLRATITQTVREYGAFGIFGAEDGRRRYGFIHGDWALDNSRGNKFCGVNSELTVLRDTGCYADFTFPKPTVPDASPRKINSIYYAVDDPRRPKSYDTGRNVERGGRPSDDVLMVQGCVHPYFLNGSITGLRIVGDGITTDRLGLTSKRVDLWINTGVHISGKRNWIFIKTHTHGAEDAPVVTAKPMDEALSYMEERYNDGDRYILHYVTARELYNMVKAIEADEPGTDPNIYRNYRISEPRYIVTEETLEASSELQSLVARTYRG